MRGSSGCTYRQRDVATTRLCPAAFTHGLRNGSEPLEQRQSPGPMTSTPRGDDGVGDFDGPSCHFSVQPLDHPAIELDRAAGGVFRAFEGGDHLAGVFDLLGRRSEDGVASHDLAGMDHGIAAETELACLGAFLPKAVDVAEIAVGSVEYLQPICAG